MLIYDVPHLTIRPPESDALIANPGKGMVSFQRFNGDPLTCDGSWNDEGPLEFAPAPERLENTDYPPCSIAYFRWYWAHFEPCQGHYRWDLIDHVLSEGERRGQTVQIRIMPVGGSASCYTGRGPGVPDWYAALAETTENPRCPGNREPVYSSDEYLRHWGDMIRAFGARYDGHPNLESFDAGCLDWWGEGGGVRGGEDFQRQTDRLLDVYRESFRKTPLLALVNGYQLKAGIRRGFGWRADSFGDVTMHQDNDPAKPLSWNHMYNYYPMQIAEALAGEVWKLAPVAMESGWVPLYWHARKFPIDWIISQGLKYHTSTLMLKSSPIPAEWKDQVDEFLKRMGYRFVLRQMLTPTELEAGGLFCYYLWIENVGIAPIYRDYRLAFRFRQGQTKEIILSPARPSGWLPGDAWLDEKLPLPLSLQTGKVELDVALVNPESLTPAVKFANTGDLDQGWLPLTQLTVSEGKKSKNGSALL